MKKKAKISDADDSLFPEMKREQTPVSGEDVIRDDAFNYNGFEVVRQEFFAHTHEPSITFNNQKFSVNTACLKRLPDVNHVQLLINPSERQLVVRPSGDDEKDAFAWCVRSKKRHPKYVTGGPFMGKLMDLMNWNPDYRYKVLGKLICSNSRYLFMFDLTVPNIYRRISRDGENPKSIRSPLFPEEWRNQFGLPVEEHSKRFHVKIFKGHAVLGIKGGRDDSNPPHQEETP